MAEVAKRLLAILMSQLLVLRLLVFDVPEHLGSSVLNLIDGSVPLVEVALVDARAVRQMGFLIVVVSVLDDRQADLVVVVVARYADLVGASFHPRHEVVAVPARALD